MPELRFTSIGKVPRVASTETYVFHDAQGTIRHVHEHIVLEGAKSRAVDTMLKEVRTHAASYGNDVSKLKLLRVAHALDPGMQYRVDIKRGALLAKPLESRPPLKQASGEGKVRTAARKARKKR